MAAIHEIGPVSSTLKAWSSEARAYGSKTFLEDLQSVIEAQSNQKALALSLVHNKPDDEGRTRVQQERDRLERMDKDLWERTKSPLSVGTDVLIPADTPVGLGSELASYITEKPLQGTLTNVFGGYGGAGYLDRSVQKVEPLFKVDVVPEGHEPTDVITLLVPNDLLVKSL